MDDLAILTSSRVPNDKNSGAHLWIFIVLMLALIAGAVSMLGATPGMPNIITSITPTPSIIHEARTYTISYKYGVFSPTNIRIHVGDTVRWRNDDRTPIRIIAELQKGQQTPVFDSIGPVQPDSSFAVIFANAGVFGYYNSDLRNELGVVIVRE